MSSIYHFQIYFLYQSIKTYLAYIYIDQRIAIICNFVYMLNIKTKMPFLTCSEIYRKKKSIYYDSSFSVFFGICFFR
jgi:hypothetical protein